MLVSSFYGGRQHRAMGATLVKPIYQLLIAVISLEHALRTRDDELHVG